jgi:hypothetical protein
MGRSDTEWGVSALRGCGAVLGGGGAVGSRVCFTTSEDLDLDVAALGLQVAWSGNLRVVASRGYVNADVVGALVDLDVVGVAGR